MKQTSIDLVTDFVKIFALVMVGAATFFSIGFLIILWLSCNQ